MVWPYRSELRQNWRGAHYVTPAEWLLATSRAMVKAGGKEGVGFGREGVSGICYGIMSCV